MSVRTETTPDPPGEQGVLARLRRAAAGLPPGEEPPILPPEEEDGEPTAELAQRQPGAEHALVPVISDLAAMVEVDHWGQAYAIDATATQRVMGMAAKASRTLREPSRDVVPIEDIERLIAQAEQWRDARRRIGQR